MTRLFPLAVIFALALVGSAVAANAQPLGTFTWQLQPFCNVVTVNLIQQGSSYTMDGFDDQCRAAQRAALVGVATPNPDGSIAVGLNIVTAPSGRGVQVAARFTLPSASGTWSDSAGNSGTFAFGASTGGSPRPVPAAGGTTIPNTFALLTDGGFLARGTAGVGTIPASGFGTRMMWHPNKAAFRAGEVNLPSIWDDVNIGSHSAAFGLNSLAAGPYSFAGGANAIAVGISSVAIGSNAQANGNYSAAFGADTNAGGAFAFVSGRNNAALGAYSVVFGQLSSATGSHSAAFGNTSTAGGIASFAAGTGTFANGSESVAMGLRVSAGGNGSVVLGSDAVATAAASGNFVFADRSTTADMVVDQPNQFTVRSTGGVYFYTSTNFAAGQRLAPGGSQWLGHSDVNKKHLFRDLDGEGVLGKLAAMAVQEWSYKTQGAAIRHVGPTAQDFHAAFGLGEDPLYIGHMDIDGIAMAGVKALEARTRELNERLTRENDDLRARLARLETLLDKR